MRSNPYPSSLLSIGEWSHTDREVTRG
jgi:hypothetical protein